MSKTDPYVRDLLRKNQYAEALRYYRTRYKVERPEAMKVLQEIQSELSGAPPASGLVTSSGAPLAAAPTVTPRVQEPPTPPPRVEVPHVKPAPTPPAAPPVPSAPPPLSYQTPVNSDAGAVRSDTHWSNLPAALRWELQALLEEDRALDAIRTYWRESPVELRDAKERVLRWATSFPPKR
jgi:hypothetical protein